MRTTNAGTDERQELARRVASERSKRLLVCGSAISFFAALWLALAWHASRIVESECVVQLVQGGANCTIAHVTRDGKEHTLPWERCEAPTRWPRSPIGSRTRCYYSPGSPDDVFFTPEPVAWLTPMRAALLALGMAVGGLGLAIGVRARRRPAEPGAPAADAGPYRTADPPPALAEEPRTAVAPLAIELWSSSGATRIALGAPAAALGATIVALSLVNAAEASRDVTVAHMGLVALGVAVTFVALLAIGFRSGLVLDRERGDLHSWWGLWRPWFRRHHALSALRTAEARVTLARRMRTKDLELHFEAGRTRTFACDDVDEAVRKIREYVTTPRRSPDRDAADRS